MYVNGWTAAFATRDNSSKTTVFDVAGKTHTRTRRETIAIRFQTKHAIINNVLVSLSAVGLPVDNERTKNRLRHTEIRVGTTRTSYDNVDVSRFSRILSVVNKKKKTERVIIKTIVAK